MRTRFAFLLLATLSAAFAPAPLPRHQRRGAQQDDMVRMQGRWEVINPRTGHTHVTLKGTHWVFYRNESVNSEWEIVLDTNASPKALDLRSSAARSTYVIPAIYRFDGDTLRVVYAGGGRQRPAAADLDGGGNFLLVMRRVGR